VQETALRSAEAANMCVTRIAAGMDVDRFAPRLSSSSCIGMNFFMEAGKAARATLLLVRGIRMKFKPQNQVLDLPHVNADLGVSLRTRIPITTWSHGV